MTPMRPEGGALYIYCHNGEMDESRESGKHDVAISNAQLTLCLDLTITNKEAFLNAVDGVVGHLSSLMGRSINRYPKNLMELYSYIFESLGPAESKELLKQWILAIEGERPPLFHQKVKNWPPIKGEQVNVRIPLHFHCDWTFSESQGILLYIFAETTAGIYLLGNWIPSWRSPQFIRQRNSNLRWPYFCARPNYKTRGNPPVSSSLAFLISNKSSTLMSSFLFKIRVNVPRLIKRYRWKKKTGSFVKVSPAPAISCLTTPVSNALEPAACSCKNSGCLHAPPDSGAFLMSHGWERQDCWTQYSRHIDEAFPGFCHQLRPGNFQHSASATRQAESSPFSVPVSAYHKRFFICGICHK